MRKYKIKQGTRHPDGGIQVANFEWTMCYTLFMSQVTGHNVYSHMSQIPEDLQCY